MIEFVTGRYLRRDSKTADYTRRRNEEKACGQGFDSPHLHHSNPRKEEKELLSLWLSSFFYLQGHYITFKPVENFCIIVI